MILSMYLPYNWHRPRVGLMMPNIYIGNGCDQYSYVVLAKNGSLLPTLHTNIRDLSCGLQSDSLVAVGL